MSAYFRWTHTVTPAEIDFFGLANNEAYLGWMNEAALGHSAERGWPVEKYIQSGFGFVVRRHEIEYLTPAYLNDAIAVVTWVARVERATSLRRYRVFRATDRKMLAEASTLWAYVEFSTGRLTRIPAAISGSFDIVGDQPPAEFA